MLALAAAGVNLVVCGAVAAVLIVLRPGPAQETQADDGFATPGQPVTVTETASPQDAFPTDSSTWETTSTTSAPPADCQQVAGPGGMTACVPNGWPTKVATGPGAMQADDPTGSRWLRYGGSATAVTDSYQVHADYERTFSSNKSNYASLRLERTYVRGMSAIDWEFEYDATDGRRHVRSVYWLAQGYEYFVYASAPVALWPDTQEIFDVMLDNATP